MVDRVLVSHFLDLIVAPLPSLKGIRSRGDLIIDSQLWEQILGKQILDRAKPRHLDHSRIP